jgi:hypothetical protein
LYVSTRLQVAKRPVQSASLSLFVLLVIICTPFFLSVYQVAKRLFDIDIVPADGEAPVWHADVRFFKLMQNGAPRAYFYLDPYSRPAEKRGGAWMAEVRLLLFVSRYLCMWVSLSVCRVCLCVTLRTVGYCSIRPRASAAAAAAPTTTANTPPCRRLAAASCCLLLPKRCQLTAAAAAAAAGGWPQQAAASCCRLSARLASAACGAHGVQPEPSR